MGDFLTALGAWQSLLGRENVLTSGEEILRYSRTTLPSAPRPLAILKPSGLDQVQEIVKIANREEVCLYTISCGKNWGYGDACPVGDGQVVLDLSNMNRIIEVDPVLGYAVVEPGVTQEQLFNYLESKNVPFWMDATGSGLYASVIGNLVERGFGHTPYGDHFANSSAMQVVLADGSVFETGFGLDSKTRLGAVYKWGLGPSLDGLFTQSNMGVVTRAVVWLHPKPESFCTFLFRVKEDVFFETLIDRLRPLRLNGTIQSNLHIANDFRTISSHTQYLWDKMGGKTPLSEDIKKALLADIGLGAWSAVGAFYGTSQQIRAQKRKLRSVMRGIGSVIFIGPGLLDLFHRTASILALFGITKFKNVLRIFRHVYELLQGRPSDYFLKSSQWRVRKHTDPGSLDPLDNNCGFYWISPLCPATGKEGRTLLSIIKETLNVHRFEPMITVTLLNGRSMAFVTTIYFDMNDEEERDRARRCYNELLEKVYNGGYVPYRMGIDSMDRLCSNNAPYWDAVGRIKRALDPKGILAPGRYDPSNASNYRRF